MKLQENIKNLKIGVIGCGSMGGEIIKSIIKKEIPNSSLIWVFDEDKSRISKFNFQSPTKIFFPNNLKEAINIKNVDLIVEAASPYFVKENCLKILESGKSMLIMSSGALISNNFYTKINETCSLYGSKIYVPSGAVGGIDAIKSVKNHLQDIKIKTTKHPDALMGAQGYKKFENTKIDTKTTIFEGNASEAIKLFPANVNISATISMIGIGPERTKVTIIADTKTHKNTHEIFVNSHAGNFSFKLENFPHPNNKKTSYLAILSAIETLKSITKISNIGT